MTLTTKIVRQYQSCGQVMPVPVVIKKLACWRPPTPLQPPPSLPAACPYAQNALQNPQYNYRPYPQPYPYPHPVYAMQQMQQQQVQQPQMQQQQMQQQQMQQQQMQQQQPQYALTISEPLAPQFQTQ